MKSIISAFERVAQTRGAAVAAHYRDFSDAWRSITWSEVDQQRREATSGLISLGMESGDCVHILASTSLDWMVVDLAVLSAEGKTVGVYTAALPEECEFVIKDSQARWVFVEDEDQLEKLLSRREVLSLVRRVVVLSDHHQSTDWTISWADFLALGRTQLENNTAEIQRRVNSLSEATVATIVYTSGTSGRPKGVVLTHGNLLSVSEGCIQAQLIRENDVQLLFLPMAQVFAKLLECIWFVIGHEMAIDANTRRLAQNLQEIRPTVMASVPRVYERIYSRFITLGGMGPRRRLFKWALSQLTQYAQRKREVQPISLSLALRMQVAERLVFKRLEAPMKAFFGGRIRVLVSGSAPLSQLMTYFFDRCGLTLLEGYGLTETSGAVTINRPHAFKIGSVGPPVPGTAVKVADDGEVLIRGPGVMEGYWARTEATDLIKRADGWLATGDVGHIDGDGFLTITGRKKDLIVTAGGRNIAPQKIESAIRSASALIEHVLVHGDRRRFLSALITLEREAVRQLAEEHKIPGHYAAVCRSPQAKAVVQDVVDRVNQGLAVHEQVRAFKVLEEEFKVGEELSHALKLRREACADKYAPILNAFYSDRFN
ncbi:MAG: AMP-dependent synthetase/ligase [Myxococcales bacterium]|nr:AMP-dependent synthetase/ligase [Myxococcales bacterium]